MCLNRRSNLYMSSVKTAFMSLKSKCSCDLIVSLGLLEGEEKSLKVEQLKKEDQCFEGYLHPPTPIIETHLPGLGVLGVNEP